MNNTINFFSYVSGDDEKMIAAIFGRNNISHQGAVLQGYELCVQTAKDIPALPREILTKKRGPNFELYTIRPNHKKNLPGIIWQVTPQEYEYLRNYELIDLGMSEDITAKAKTADGKLVIVQTYGLNKNVNNITKVVEPDYIRKEIPSEKKIKNAILVREEYIKNKK